MLYHAENLQSEKAFLLTEEDDYDIAMDHAFIISSLAPVGRVFRTTTNFYKMIDQGSMKNISNNYSLYVNASKL